MGVDAPTHPAPTESSIVETATVATNTNLDTKDLSSDVSRQTDHTSYSLPDDGSPITISTRRKKSSKAREREAAEGNLTRTNHQSQTSLLIEYFEGGKGPSNVHSRPSVRVKVTPSAARKIKDSKDHIQISETGRHRTPSYTKRISLSPRVNKGEAARVGGGSGDDDQSLSSYASATEESSIAPRTAPIEVEVMHKDPASRSAASSPRDKRYVPPNASDVSSMPPDSFLESQPVTRTPKKNRSRSEFRDEPLIPTAETLQTPSRRRSRSLSRERITQKVMEKLGSKGAESSGKRVESSSRGVEASSSSGGGGGKPKRRSKSRSRSVSKEHIETVKSPRRRSSKTHRDEDLTSGAESSLLTTSGVSTHRKSVDQASFVSGTSRSSHNNPKLLGAVEDVIKRLILPELNALKDEQRIQQERYKADRGHRDSYTSQESASREGSRRTSGTSTRGDRPRVILNRDEHDPGTVLSGDSIRVRKDRKSRKSDSPADRHERDRTASSETTVRTTPHKKRSKDRHTARDAAVGGVVAGALTAAALRHHDSRSSVDDHERVRKKRSKSRSRGATAADQLEPSSRHDVPALPMSSDFQDSEVTRESILTERTDRPHSATSQDRHETAHETSSSRTPTKTPTASPRVRGTHHGNNSRGDLSIHSVPSDRSIRKSDRESDHVKRGVAAGLAAAGLATAAKAQHDQKARREAEHAREYEREYERDYEQQQQRQQQQQHNQQGYYSGQGRALSPIQSVASYQEESTAGPNRESYRTVETSGSASPVNRGHRHEHLVSPMSSSQSLKEESGASHLDRSGAGQGRGTMSRKEADLQYWDEQHQENDRARYYDDVSPEESTVEYKHMTNYTDDSADGQYLDKVAAGQHVLGIGANPEYRHTPVAVSSAVASLHEPSVLDVRSTRSGGKGGDVSYPNSLNEYRAEGDQYGGADRDLPRSQQGSPTKTGRYAAYGETRRTGSQASLEAGQKDTTGHSRGQQEEDDEEPIHLGASGLPIAGDPMPEIGHGLSDESDINTNPSIIQGPIGGVQHTNRDHWPYEPTPRHSGLQGVNSPGAGLSDYGYEKGGEFKDVPHAAGLEDERVEGIDRDIGGMQQDSFHGGNAAATNPLKDEGYISSANPRSPGAVSPDPMPKGLSLFNDDGFGGMDNLMAGDDPFTGTSHTRHLSGNSHGMASPLYDSATGKGIDRIQSKDVVALMDHLTVRDAQRSARDTEILVTLVRSAAEMRNSFEDMKRLLAEQESNIINNSEDSHERSVQKIMHGPRPQPLGTPRVPRRSSAEEEMIEDIPAKRRNVFKRALKGLGMKSSNDLAKIEEMLVQLLGDVEGLKAAQELRPGGTQGTSLNSYDNLRTVPEGYEPEGQAGTGSTQRTGSGYFSNTNPPSRQPSAMRGGAESLRIAEHRISTVPEGDEELMLDYDDVEPSPRFDRNDPLLTPTRRSPRERPTQDAEFLTPGRDATRGSSVPLDTPPQTQVPFGASHSNENTPKTDRSRKHKSNSSSIFPKISRWSETTASTVARQFRGSGGRVAKTPKDYLEPASRSGSDLDSWAGDRHDPAGADRLTGYSREQTPTGQHPPSPLVPAGESSALQEDAKYQAHRNSLNLEHPQPRPGPSYRYQSQLESEAHNYGYAASTVSSEQGGGGGGGSQHRYSGSAGNRYSGGAGNLSPISDGGYSPVSASNEHQQQQGAAPPRPPKIPTDEAALVPPPKSRARESAHYSPSSSGQQLPASLQAGDAKNHARSYSGAGGLQSSPTRNVSGPYPAGVPARKPMGARPISSAGSNKQGSDDGGVRRNRNRDTFGGSTQAQAGADEDVTF